MRSRTMSYRDSALDLRDLALRQARRVPAGAGAELLPLTVAAAIAYGRLVGDPSEVRNTSVLEDRLDRIALAISAVATVYTGDTSDNLLVRKADLTAAIDVLRRAGVAFNA